jgi:Fic family protein
VTPPEPLHAFDRLAGPMAEMLRRVDALAAEYLARSDAGQVLPNVREAIRVELTYHSNAIEGNTLTLRQTQLVIEGQSPAGERPMRELYEARNHDRALRLVERWAADRQATSPLTAADLLDVHAHVMADIDPGGAGRLRDHRVLITGTGFVPPGSHKFDVLLPALLALAMRPDVHPVLRAAELHYDCAAVHPFADGNGRTARLMMNYDLLRHGYPLAVIEVTRRGEYLAALDHANAGRLEPFATFVAESVERSIARAIG